MHLAEELPLGAVGIICLLSTNSRWNPSLILVGRCGVSIDFPWPGFLTSHADLRFMIEGLSRFAHIAICR